ncbi:Uncharacterised protein [Chromobacterium violaceum]|uniref:Uncharacterized protein n=1 Tax=Chromobacterium violaceum TaxID=536 RepID=A0A447T7B6_CHRVL|nr:Uncharacterised protein [Chromobacterium violaceum]
MRPSGLRPAQQVLSSFPSPHQSYCLVGIRTVPDFLSGPIPPARAARCGPVQSGGCTSYIVRVFRLASRISPLRPPGPGWRMTKPGAWSRTGSSRPAGETARQEGAARRPGFVCGSSRLRLRQAEFMPRPSGGGCRQRGRLMTKYNIQSTWEVTTREGIGVQQSDVNCQKSAKTRILPKWNKKTGWICIQPVSRSS